MTHDLDGGGREETALERCIAENIALRCLLNMGCDAHNDGPHHTTIGTGKNEFCVNCGEMTRGGKSKPWMNEDRLERAIRRLALPQGPRQ